MSISLNYEMQFAEGTGSASLDNYDIAWQSGTRGNYPKFAQPLDFEQRHSGSLVLDYRIPQTSRSILRNSGLNTMFTFNSGNPYTATQVVKASRLPGGMTTIFPIFRLVPLGQRQLPEFPDRYETR
jgi:hypothetical protein